MDYSIIFIHYIEYQSQYSPEVIANRPSNAVGATWWLAALYCNNGPGGSLCGLVDVLYTTNNFKINTELTNFGKYFDKLTYNRSLLKNFLQMLSFAFVLISPDFDARIISVHRTASCSSINLSLY